MKWTMLWSTDVSTFVEYWESQIKAGRDPKTELEWKEFLTRYTEEKGLAKPILAIEGEIKYEHIAKALKDSGVSVMEGFGNERKRQD